MKNTLLCTICDDRFLPGAEVLLYSLSEHLCDFESYPLKIYYDDEISPLSPSSRDSLSRIAPHVQFEAVACREYREARLKCESHRPSYLTLEAFRETDYETVVFLDNDILCVNDFSEILPLGEEFDFVACEAGKVQPDGGRLATQFGPRRGRWGKRKHMGMFGRRQTKINAGFFIAGKRVRSEQIYQDLLRIVRQRRIALSLDQWVINRYFGCRPMQLHLLPNEYNWRAPDRLSPENIDDVKLVHYAGFTHLPKPWSAEADADLWANRLWHDYADRIADNSALATAI